MKSTSANLAGRNRRLLIVVSEFANMGDSPECWRAFCKRWPTLFPQALYTESEAEIQLNVKRAAHPVTGNWPPEVFELDRNRATGIDVRLFRPTADRKWVDYKDPEILRLRNLLRDAWRGGPTANQSIEELLSFSSQLRSVSCDWRRASIVFSPLNEMQAACYALLLNANRARFCANPDCPAPYFVAKRATQRYCSPDCLKPFQKQWKLDWWNRQGKARRTDASAKSRKGGKNVTRKTR